MTAANATWRLLWCFSVSPLSTGQVVQLSRPCLFCWWDCYPFSRLESPATDNRYSVTEYLQGPLLLGNQNNCHPKQRVQDYWWRDTHIQVDTDIIIYYSPSYSVSPKNLYLELSVKNGPSQTLESFCIYSTTSTMSFRMVSSDTFVRKWSRRRVAIFTRYFVKGKSSTPPSALVNARRMSGVSVLNNKGEGNTSDGASSCPI